MEIPKPPLLSTTHLLKGTAKLSKIIINYLQHSYHETSNANGKPVNNFIQESNLFVANEYF